MVQLAAELARLKLAAMLRFAKLVVIGGEPVTDEHLMALAADSQPGVAASVMVSVCPAEVASMKKRAVCPALMETVTVLIGWFPGVLSGVKVEPTCAPTLEPIGPVAV